MILGRLCLAFVAFTTIDAVGIDGQKILAESKQPTASSEPAHEAASIGDEGEVELKPDLAALVQQQPATPKKQQLEDAKEQQLETSKQVEHIAALKITDGAAQTESVDIDIVVEEAEQAKLRSDFMLQKIRLAAEEAKLRQTLAEGAKEEEDTQSQQMVAAEVAADGSDVEVSTIQVATGGSDGDLSSIEVAADGSETSIELAKRSPISIAEEPEEQPHTQTKSTTEILVQVAADGSEVDLAKRNPMPMAEDPEEEPHSETMSTTEILVQPSGAILAFDVAPAQKAPLPHKARAGTNARRAANDREQGRATSSFHDPHSVSDSVLRQEPEMPATKVEVSTTESPVLRTEKTPPASPVVATQVDTAQAAKTTEAKPATEPATGEPVIDHATEPTTKPAMEAQIHLASPIQVQPVYMSRSHRIPTSRPPPAQQEGTTTTTASALDVVEPEPLGWKHGLVPGIMSHLNAEEATIIQVSIAVFMAIVVFGICACRSLTKTAEVPEIAGSEGQSRGSMFNGLSSVDFVDDNAGVRAMLSRIWKARRVPFMEPPTYPGGVETPTPTVLAQGQSQPGDIYLDPSLF